MLTQRQSTLLLLSACTHFLTGSGLVRSPSDYAVIGRLQLVRRCVSPVALPSCFPLLVAITVLWDARAKQQRIIRTTSLRGMRTQSEVGTTRMSFPSDPSRCVQRGLSSSCHACVAVRSDAFTFFGNFCSVCRFVHPQIKICPS